MNRQCNLNGHLWILGFHGIRRGLYFRGEEDAGDDIKVLVRLRPEQRWETNIYSNFGNQKLLFSQQIFIGFLPRDRHWTRKSRDSLQAGKERKYQPLLQSEMLLAFRGVTRMWKDFSLSFKSNEIHGGWQTVTHSACRWGKASFKKRPVLEDQNPGCCYVLVLLLVLHRPGQSS